MLEQGLGKCIPGFETDPGVGRLHVAGRLTGGGGELFLNGELHPIQSSQLQLYKVVPGETFPVRTINIVDRGDAVKRTIHFLDANNIDYSLG